jgi:hypothetical protein
MVVLVQPSGVSIVMFTSSTISPIISFVTFHIVRCYHANIGKLRKWFVT